VRDMVDSHDIEEKIRLLMIRLPHCKYYHERASAAIWIRISWCNRAII
jgi:hypothetical protein